VLAGVADQVADPALVVLTHGDHEPTASGISLPAAPTRNRVHHQWADALTLSEGLSAPLVAPIVAHEWRGRRLADLPHSEAPKRHAAAKALEAESAYERLLADHPARVVLGELLSPFRQFADLLEPPLPSRDT
jgi:hypothetical protein